MSVCARARARWVVILVPFLLPFLHLHGIGNCGCGGDGELLDGDDEGDGPEEAEEEESEEKESEEKEAEEGEAEDEKAEEEESEEEEPEEGEKKKTDLEDSEETIELEEDDQVTQVPDVITR